MEKANRRNGQQAVGRIARSRARVGPAVSSNRANPATPVSRRGPVSAMVSIPTAVILLTVVSWWAVPPRIGALEITTLWSYPIDGGVLPTAAVGDLAEDEGLEVVVGGAWTVYAFTSSGSVL
jgi:hypothetical protein